nr:hypothetical protein [Tanacetum cinerariifolium]
MAWRCRADEFEEEEDPQEEEDDMEIDIEEDENEQKLTYPYEEMDPLNPLPPTSESEPDDEIKVENPIEHEDETVPTSVYKMDSILRRLCGRETMHALVEKKGKAKDKFYGKLILELGNEVHSSVEQGTAAMEKLVEKLGNTEDKVERKKLKKELKEARFSNTFLSMQNERGIVFEERPNEAINVLIEDEKIPSSESRGSPPARKANVRNDASGSGPVRAAPAIRECTFTRFMKCNPAIFCSVKGSVELQRWFEKTESIFKISECAEGKKVKFADAILEGPAFTWWKTKVATMCLETVNEIPWTKMKQLITTEFCPIERFNELGLMCSGIVEPKRVKVDAYIRLLTDNIKGEVTSSKPADLNKACMIKCHKYGKVGHKEMYCKDKSVATGANTQPIWTSYDYGKQGHTRNQCPKKVKQGEVREARGRDYAIKDVEPQGPNVVTDTFSAMLDINLIKIGSSYKVKLSDGRVASTNTVSKGCTFNLVNHIFEIDLMTIELSTFNVIIGMDWLVKHDVVIVCGEKVVCIPYVKNMTYGIRVAEVLKYDVFILDSQVFGYSDHNITFEFIIMSNTNNNMQTQTSNTLHNAIMEAGSKDRPPMLAPGNYVQWKSRIKRFIDTKPNHKLIHYCLTNAPYKLDWKGKEVPISEGSPIGRTERVHETYKNVSQEIRDQLNAKAKVVQIILTGIDNDIHSTVDACPNACEMWKVIERLKHGESINV